MKKRNLVIFLGILAVFLLFFLQFPLKGSLTGDIDGIGNLAMYKQMMSAFEAWLFSQPAGSVCYPIDHVWVYFGSDFGIGIIHVLFNYLGMPDLWAHWLFISLLFTLNTFTLYLFLKLLFTGRNLAALSGALIFSFSHFTLGNLENPNTLVFFITFLSLAFYIKHIRTDDSKYRYFTAAALLGALQIYLSPYNFLFHSIIWAIFILAFEAKSINRTMVWKYLVTAIGYLVLISPFIRFYLFHDNLELHPDYLMTKEVASSLGLAFSDYFRFLPNHLYMNDADMELFSWTGRIKAAYLGVSLYILVLTGLFMSGYRRISAVLVITGVVMATGPYIVFPGGSRMANITWPLYEYLNFGNVFRITSRGFFITLFGLTILATSGLVHLRKKEVYLLPVILVALVMLENIPWPMMKYEHHNVLNPDPEMISYIKSSEKVALSLPTGLFSYEEARREYIYMYWQHFHRQHTLNGNLGFYPVQRIHINDLLTNLNNNNLNEVISANDVGVVVFHKDLALENEYYILDSLEVFPGLSKTLETERSAIFEVSQ